MTILYVDSFPHWGHGGAQVSLLELATGLAPPYRAVLLGVRGGSLLERFDSAGVETVGVPRRWISRPDPRSPLKRLLHRTIDRRRIARVVRQVAPELVHLNCEGAMRSVGAAATAEGTPFVLHVRDMDRDWFGGGERRALRSAAAVLVASEAMRDHAIRIGAPPGKVRVIPNGVDPAPYGPARARRLRTRRGLGLRDGDMAIGIAGAIIPRKGHVDLARAAATPSLRDRRVRFLVLGRDPHPGEPHMRALARDLRELGVADRFQLLGWRDDMPDLLAALDLVAAPFRNEAFGRVVVESFLAGTPVVAYREGGLPELVRDGLDGILVPPGDHAALAEAIHVLASEPGRLGTMRRNALDRAEAFTLESHRSAVQALYAELAG